MLYNFHVEHPKKSSRAGVLLLVLIWLLVLRNLLQIYAWPTPPSKPLKANTTPTVDWIALLRAVSQLPASANMIYKMDIQPHEMLLYGKTFQAHDLSIWLHYFHHIHPVLKVEVRQWDLIKSGHWRFIIALVY